MFLCMMMDYNYSLAFSISLSAFFIVKFSFFKSSIVFRDLPDYWKACKTVDIIVVSLESNLMLVESFSISLSSSLIRLSFSPN